MFGLTCKTDVRAENERLEREIRDRCFIELFGVHPRAASNPTGRAAVEQVIEDLTMMEIIAKMLGTTTAQPGSTETPVSLALVQANRVVWIDTAPIVARATERARSYLR